MVGTPPVLQYPGFPLGLNSLTDTDMKNSQDDESKC